MFAGMDPNFQPTPKNVLVPTAIAAVLKWPLILPLYALETPLGDKVRLLSSGLGQNMFFFWVCINACLTKILHAISACLE